MRHGKKVKVATEYFEKSSILTLNRTVLRQTQAHKLVCFNTWKLEVLLDHGIL